MASWIVLNLFFWKIIHSSKGTLPTQRLDSSQAFARMIFPEWWHKYSRQVYLNFFASSATYADNNPKWRIGIIIGSYIKKSARPSKHGNVSSFTNWTPQVASTSGVIVWWQFNEFRQLQMIFQREDHHPIMQISFLFHMSLSPTTSCSS